MSELAVLEERLKLVELSATLQRATLAHRIQAVEARPARTLINMLLNVASRPAARRAALAAAMFAWRTWRVRRAHA